MTSARVALAMRLRRLLGALACAGGMMGSLPRQAHAEPTADFFVALHYDLEDENLGCWDEPEFRRGVARVVGYDPFRADAAIGVAVHVGGSPTFVDGRVEWKSTNGARMGERRFLAKDGNCAKLLSEMSFAVGMQIDLLRPNRNQDRELSSTTPGRDSLGSDAATHPSSATQSPPAPLAPPGAGVSSGVQSDRATASSDRRGEVDTDFNRWRMWLGVGPAITWGMSPSLTGQGHLFLGARRRDLSLGLGILGTLPVVDREADGSGFREYLLAGSAALCAHRALFFGCLLGQTGTLRVTGLRVDQPQSPSAFMAHAGARLGLIWELSPTWLVQSQIEALGLLTPRTITLRRAAVWEMPALSLSVGIDLAARFR